MEELEERAAELRVDTQVDESGAPVVTLSGELDSSNVQVLEQALTPIAAIRPERVVFEMAGLRFMDSAGIAVLIDVAAKVKQVVLRNPSEIVRRVVEVTGLTGVLSLEP